MADRETYKPGIAMLTQMGEELRQFYGEVMIHSGPDGLTCIHLGDPDQDKGCRRGNLADAFAHANQHFLADWEIVQAGRRVAENPDG